MKRLSLYVIAVLFFIPSISMGQISTISGKVTDGNGEALIGVNVVVDELSLGSATNTEGEYAIIIADGIGTRSATLIARFVGFETTTKAITLNGTNQTHDFVMREDRLNLQEVVVTGVASSTSKARAEVAVARLDVEELTQDKSYQDLSQLMNGKVSGVSVQPSSGNVGGGIRFVMRAGGGLNGQGQPVVYVDGVRINSGQLNFFGVGGQQIGALSTINPDDIATIDVLKGPAGAALYGTSGSNGVILITTKSGSVSGGNSVNVNYKTILGTNQQAGSYDKFSASLPDLANSFFRNGDVRENGLSIDGGSNFIRYYASYNNRSEDGHINNNHMERQSFSANFEVLPSSKLNFRANTNYSIQENNRPQNDNNIYGYLGNSLLSGSPFVFTDSLSIESLINLTRLNRFTASIEGAYRPFKGFEVKGVIGYDGLNTREDESFPSDLSYSGVTNGSRNVGSFRSNLYTYDVNARYAYGFDKIQASTVVGVQLFNNISNSVTLQKQNFATELITTVGAGEDFINGGENASHSRSAGIFALQEFNYDNFVFASVGLRQDYATAVGVSAPNIFYPKVSMALRLDRFAKNIFSFLKLRAAYGETGNLPGLLDGNRLRWGPGVSGFGNGAVVSFVGNPTIKPERIREIEFGAEMGFLDDRIGMDVTYYRSDAEDSIIGRVLAPSTGFTANNVPFNVGSVEGSGVEFALNFTPVRNNTISVDANFLWNYQESKVIDIGDAQDIFDGFDLNVYSPGLARSAFYTSYPVATYDDAGVYTGAEARFTDPDTGSNREILGSPFPTHTGSFALNISLFKNFSVYALTDWVIDQQMFNLTKQFQVIFGANYERNEAGIILGLSDPDEEMFPGVGPADVGSAEYLAAGTTHAKLNRSYDGGFIEEADYFKLREISVRYDLSDLLKKYWTGSFTKRVTFALSGRNLWTSTSYEGADPEVNFAGARSLSRGQDFLTLPNPRTIYGTFNIGF